LFNDKNNGKSNIYLKHLLDCINERKKESFNNIAKTDIYSQKDVEEGINFFNKLVECCLKLKPDYYVKNIILIMDLDNTIKNVEYEYFTSKDKISEPGFIFHQQQ